MRRCRGVTRLLRRRYEEVKGRLSSSLLPTFPLLVIDLGAGKWPAAAAAPRGEAEGRRGGAAGEAPCCTQVEGRRTGQRRDAPRYAGERVEVQLKEILDWKYVNLSG